MIFDGLHVVPANSRVLNAALNQKPSRLTIDFLAMHQIVSIGVEINYDRQAALLPHYNISPDFEIFHRFILQTIKAISAR